ncbi:MAG: uncharacterized protein KVP18_004254 [Porospora cf. gigantea A]|uniref:uncharacterized protein n=1 Tax=Porospora cf. gigantea A TaxID=2853593 RepID=UPI003559C8D2|nr:MAG: hypothetical protein KVP18_004254 [Porospora cf. gigantea A]
MSVPNTVSLPPGFQLVPRVRCAVPGCLDCNDIFCQRCEAKEQDLVALRRTVFELEARAKHLQEYITQLQFRLSAERSSPRDHHTNNIFCKSHKSFETAPSSPERGVKNSELGDLMQPHGRSMSVLLCNPSHMG